MRTTAGRFRCSFDLLRLRGSFRHSQGLLNAMRLDCKTSAFPADVHRASDESLIKLYHYRFPGWIVRSFLETVLFSQDFNFFPLAGLN